MCFLEDSPCESFYYTVIEKSKLFIGTLLVVNFFLSILRYYKDKSKSPDASVIKLQKITVKNPAINII